MPRPRARATGARTRNRPGNGDAPGAVRPAAPPRRVRRVVSDRARRPREVVHELRPVLADDVRGAVTLDAPRLAERGDVDGVEAERVVEGGHVLDGLGVVARRREGAPLLTARGVAVGGDVG